MMVNTDVHSGYLLHSRPFRDTSLICDFFLKDAGRVSVLYRGVKKSGKAGVKARLLQPFSRLSLSFQGRSELKIGALLESDGASTFLQGKQLYSGLYLNELLIRLLHKGEPLQNLFSFYEAALGQLQNTDFEAALRQFEHRLLAELGYELVLDIDALGNEVVPDGWYLFESDQGVRPIPEQPCDAKLLQHCFLGQHLLAIQQHAYDDASLRSSKRLSRLALASHLGEKPLKSRDLFVQMAEY